MSRDARQSTAATIRVGPVVDTTGLVLTTATIVAKVSKAGGALGARSDATAITHDSDGYFLLSLNATDTGTVGRLRVAITGTGFLPFCEDFMVLAPAVYDVLYGTTALATLAAADVWAVATRQLTATQAFSNTGTWTGNLTGSVGSIAVGGITSFSFAAGAIDATAIASDALGALELSVGASGEIATAIRTELAIELARIDVATSTRLASADYVSADPDAIATAVWTTTTPGDLAVAGSPGALLASMPVAEGGTVQSSPAPTLTRFTILPLIGVTLNPETNAYASGRMCARPRDGILGGSAFPITASIASEVILGGVEITVAGLTSALVPGVVVDLY